MTSQSNERLCACTHHIVVDRVQRVQETRRTPSTATDNKGLLRRVVRELRPWRLVLLRKVVERASASESDESDGARGLQEALPEGGFEWGRGLDVPM